MNASTTHIRSQHLETESLLSQSFCVVDEENGTASMKIKFVTDLHAR